MDVLRKPWARALAVCAGTFVVYALTRRSGNPYNQYVLLADAFLHGRVYLIDPPSFLEIAAFDGRAYVIDPPAPTLFLLPFVVLFGVGADHVLISAGVGAVAVGMFFVVAQRWWTERAFAIAMTVLVAFGTNFWWIVSDGGFWSFAHTSAVFFMAAGLVEATGRKRGWLVALCVGLAGLSRLPVFLIAPLYAYLVLDGDVRVSRENVRRILPFGLVLGLAASGYIAYNWVRYGSVFDLGYYHPQYVNEPWFARGRFDITYVPRHLRAIFLDLPAWTGEFPYLRPRAAGMALVLTTPAFLYAVRARLDGLCRAALVALALVAIPLASHGTTGWSQFGYRFALDALPALVLLTASGMRERLSRVKVGVIAVCVLVNLWGVLSFNIFGWVVV